MDTPPRKKSNSYMSWRMVVAGEDLSKNGAARPMVASGKERPRERKREGGEGVERRKKKERANAPGFVIGQ